MALQIGRALEFAHRNGLVHRDVKPQNVLLNGDGPAKVTDFGIARSLDVQRGMTRRPRARHLRLHRPGAGAGLARGRADDVYSLGVVLFELLDGDAVQQQLVASTCDHEQPPRHPGHSRRRPPSVSPTR